MFNEFKKFAMRGNVVDMGVGIIIGGAFGAIVSAFVAEVMMPVVGLGLGGTDFSNLFIVLSQGTPAGPYETLDAAKEAGAVVLGYGTFINTVVNFLIVAFALFMVVKAMNRARQAEAATPAPPPAPTKQEVLLTEIRDLLAKP
jgi:large conductance mechanosensitive channel